MHYINDKLYSRLTNEDKENVVEYLQYKTEYDEAEYSHCKIYKYTTEIQYKGLVVTIACNGFGSGTSYSYIVTKIFKNKKGEIKKAEVAPIYEFNTETKMVKYLNSKYKTKVVQSGSKEGTWVREGDQSHHMIYFVTWGMIKPHDIGFDK